MVIHPAEPPVWLPLFAHGLNELFVDEQDEGCCYECCGPCNALKQMLDAGLLDYYAKMVIETMGDSYWWKKDKVDREWLESAWRLTKVCEQHNEQ